MIIPYKRNVTFDYSLRLKSCDFITIYMQNQKSTNEFDYLSWNSHFQNLITNNKAVLQLLNDFLIFHQKNLFKVYSESFLKSVFNIIYCFNIYDDIDIISLSIREKLYKIIIVLIRFAKLNQNIFKSILKNVNKFLFGVSEEDTCYSIQAISLLSKYYLSAFFFKIFNISSLHAFFEMQNLSIIYSLCNILISMSKYPKITAQFIRNMILILQEIISEFHIPQIISKSIEVLYNLSKNSLFFFQDLIQQNISMNYGRTKISLFDFLQSQILINDDDFCYEKNSIILAFKIFRRLINFGNIALFSCVENIFQYISSQDMDIQYLSFKFFYHYLKCFNDVIPSSDLFYAKFLNTLTKSDCQIISYVFSAVIEGSLKIKTLGFLVISELFKISYLHENLKYFCDPIFIESLCSFFEIQYDFHLFDSISRILLIIIKFEENKEINYDDFNLSDMIFQSLSIDFIDYLARNTDGSKYIRQLFLFLRNMM